MTTNELKYVGSALHVWIDILEEAKRYALKGILIINNVDFVIGVSEIGLIVEMISKYDNLAGIANVKMVLPETEEINAYTVIKDALKDGPVQTEFFL